MLTFAYRIKENRIMKTPFHHSVAVAVLLSLTGCAINPPQEFQQKEESPVIYPDYSGITLPHNIAPMNFQIEEDGEQFIAVASAPKGEQLIASGKTIQWNLKEWHKLLDGNRGDTLSIDIYVQKEGTWNRYRTIKNLIAQEAIDPYLSYRLIEPLYVFYENMSLCQRDLTCFDERTLVNNGRPVEEERGRCVNCHAYQDYNRGGNMQFHVRGYKGGSLLATEDGVRKVDLKSEKSPFDGVYPAWHPTLPLIAYSTNSTRQHFHSKDRQKVEVMDLASGLILYDTKNNRVKTISDKPDELETFPAWSPDGRTLYYVSARYPEGVPMEKDSLFNHYQEFHYDIFRKTFDPESRTFSATADTVLAASRQGKSATFPRVSPDGKYLLFTMGDYGTFHIWHHDSDLYLMDLASGETRPLNEANSTSTDSYHSWSSDGSWIVFSSRRDDGSYTRPYICHFKDGQASKPFIMPQESPTYYKELFKSYNVPEFMVKPVSISRKDWQQAIEAPARRATYEP